MTDADATLVDDPMDNVFTGCFVSAMVVGASAVTLWLSLDTFPIASDVASAKATIGVMTGTAVLFIVAYAVIAITYTSVRTPRPDVDQIDEGEGEGWR